MINYGQKPKNLREMFIKVAIKLEKKRNKFKRNSKQRVKTQTHINELRNEEKMKIL